MLVAPDTSPREPRMPGRCGQLGFRARRRLLRGCDAAAVVGELSDVQLRDAGAAGARAPRICLRLAQAAGIFGHSMGGHGALMCALRNPSQIQIGFRVRAHCRTRCNVPGARRRLPTISARTSEAWREYDATECVSREPFPGPILIDQGTADQYLAEQLLAGEVFSRRREVGPAAQAAHAAGLRPRLLLHPDLHGRSFAPSCGGAEE